MKLNAAEHAQGMAKEMGITKALSYAIFYADETAPQELVNLPEGPVFMTKLENGKWKLNAKPLQKLHNFWTNVEGVLAKKAGLTRAELKDVRNQYKGTLRRSEQ